MKRGSSASAPSPFWALFTAEMRMLARDRRTLFASVLLPVLAMPLFFLLMHLGEEKRQERMVARIFEYAVVGSRADDARRLLALVDASGEADEHGEAEMTVTLTEKEISGEPSAALDAGEVHVVLEALSATEATALDEVAPRAEGSERGDVKRRDGREEVPLPLLRLHFTADWEASTTAVGELEERLGAALRERRDRLLAEAGSPLRRGELARIAEVRDVATAEERTGAAIGRWAALFMMLFLLVGGSVVAADTLAGEKERGTLETVLTSAAGREEILRAKLLAIFAVGLLITLVQLANIGFYAGLRVIELPADFVIDPDFTTLFSLVLLFVPLALLVSVILLWVSGRSATYKAFQVSLLPVMLLLLAPTMAAFLPGLELRSAISVLPIAGVAVAVREVLVGRFDLPFLALAWLSTLGAGLLVARAALEDLSSERWITSGESVPRRDQPDDGREVLGRRILGYVAAGWVLVFLASAFFGFGLRGQVLFNVVGVFLGGSLFLLRRFRLEPCRALALRPVGLSTWLGVLLGAPATFLVGARLARLSGELFPLPEKVLEALGEGILPAGMGGLELFLFVAVLPGICEEVAFRGVLLYALRRRLAPLQLAAATAAAFALFHVEWVRLLPTFFLGLLLAALVLRTGSLLPAIAWHVLNNAAGILAVRTGVDVAALSPASYAWATLAAALAWLLIWRGGGSPVKAPVKAPRR